MPTTLHGVSASPGIAVGTAHLLRWEVPEVPSRVIDDSAIDEEVARYDAMVAQAIERLRAVKLRAEEKAGAAEAAIFDVQVAILEDGDLRGRVVALCDTTVGKNYATPEQRQAYRDEVGWPLSEIVITAAWINRTGRDDLHRLIDLLETPFLIQQYWKLYPIWGTGFRQLEVLVDGELVHRSQSREHGWQNRVLRQHRITYQLNLAFPGKRPLARDYALRWIVDRARRDFPEATEVAVHWRVGQLPGTTSRIGQRYVGRAPDWEIVAEEPS